MSSRPSRLDRPSPSISQRLQRAALLLTLLALPASAGPAKKLPKVPPPPAPDPAWKSHGFLESSPPVTAGFKRLKTAPHPIIFLLVDALRPDRLGVHGYPRPLTPHLDALAGDGLVFNNFYVNAPWTKPSTTSILTGLYASRHRVQPQQAKLADRFETLPEALQKIGYQSGAVVGNGNGSGAFNLDQGFQHYVDTRSHWKGLPTAREVYDLAGGWLSKQKGADKRFLFTFVVDPHDPYHTPDPADEAAFLWEGHPEIVRIPRWEYPRGKGLSEDQRRATIAVYDAAVRYTDQEIGRFIARLKKSGIYDRATIVVTADHGDGFGEHGIYKHAHHLFDEVVRVPLVIKSPAIPAGARGHSVDALAQSIDLYPTLLRLAGGAPTPRLKGLDLIDLAAAPGPHAERRIFSEYNCFGISRTMIRTKDWKLVLQLPADEARFMATVTRKDLLPSVRFDREELQAYDLRSDPLEMKNLAPGGDPAKAPPEAQALLAELRAFIKAQPGGAPQMVEGLDAQTEANLRALGYIE